MNRTQWQASYWQELDKEIRKEAISLLFIHKVRVLFGWFIAVIELGLRLYWDWDCIGMEIDFTNEQAFKFKSTWKLDFYHWIETTQEQIIKAFRDFTSRSDISILLMNQTVQSNPIQSNPIQSKSDPINHLIHLFFSFCNRSPMKFDFSWMSTNKPSPPS